MPIPLRVHLLPASIPAGNLRGEIAIVVDVLRATTAMVRAISAGGRAIIPCLEVEEARSVASTFSPESVLLAGERMGLLIEGFDLGNSPSTFDRERCEGRTVVMTTTNGTRAILASVDADRVLIASFGNLDATSRVAASSGLAVHIVCSGTDGRISWEDALLAGAIVRGVEARAISGCVRSNDEAEIAAGLWPEDDRSTGDLAGRLARGRGGRRVRELGFGDDIEEAARIDWSDRVLELQRDPLRIVSNS